MSFPTFLPVLGRIGYSAKGIVYCLIGWIAIWSAISHKRKMPDSQGVINEVSHQPLAPVLLLLLGTGLVCYSIWRLAQLCFDTEEKGKATKGWLRRLVFLFSALTHSFLAYSAIRAALGFSSKRTHSERDGAAYLLSMEFGW